MTSSFALVGAGAVAQALGATLRAGGLPCTSVWSRTKVRARDLAATLGARSVDLSDEWGADIICVCVPDDAISEVAEQLARSSTEWAGRLVLHTSGALDAIALAPLEQMGAHTLAFHPLQSFVAAAGSAARATAGTAAGTAPRVAVGTPAGSAARTTAGTAAATTAFDGIWVSLQGTEESVALGEQIVFLAGAKPVRVDAAQKAAIHLAATIVSNYTVTLAGMANSIFAEAGIPDQVASNLLNPLLFGTARNLSVRPPGEALSGPVVRGDVQTVRRHIDVLRGSSPHLLTAYVLLATETVDLARSSGRLNHEAAEHMLDELGGALDRGSSSVD